MKSGQEIFPVTLLKKSIFQAHACHRDVTVQQQVCGRRSCSQAHNKCHLNLTKPCFFLRYFNQSAVKYHKVNSCFLLGLLTVGNANKSILSMTSSFSLSHAFSPSLSDPHSLFLISSLTPSIQLSFLGQIKQTIH